MAIPYIFVTQISFMSASHTFDWLKYSTNAGLYIGKTWKNIEPNGGLFIAMLHYRRAFVPFCPT